MGDLPDYGDDYYQDLGYDDPDSVPNYGYNMQSALTTSLRSSGRTKIRNSISHRIEQYDNSSERGTIPGERAINDVSEGKQRRPRRRNSISEMVEKYEASQRGEVVSAERGGGAFSERGGVGVFCGRNTVALDNSMMLEPLTAEEDAAAVMYGYGEPGERRAASASVLPGKTRRRNSITDKLKAFVQPSTMPTESASERENVYGYGDSERQSTLTSSPGKRTRRRNSVTAKMEKYEPSSSQGEPQAADTTDMYGYVDEESMAPPVATKRTTRRNSITATVEIFEPSSRGEYETGAGADMYGYGDEETIAPPVVTKRTTRRNSITATMGKFEPPSRGEYKAGGGAGADMYGYGDEETIAPPVVTKRTTRRNSITATMEKFEPSSRGEQESAAAAEMYGYGDVSTLSRAPPPGRRSLRRKSIAEKVEKYEPTIAEQEPAQQEKLRAPRRSSMGALQPAIERFDQFGRVENRTDREDSPAIPVQSNYSSPSKFNRKATVSMSNLPLDDNAPTSIRVPASIWNQQSSEPESSVTIGTSESTPEPQSSKIASIMEQKRTKAITAMLQVLDQKNASTSQIIQELENHKRDLTVAAQNSTAEEGTTAGTASEDKIQVTFDLIDNLSRLTRAKQDVEENKAFSKKAQRRKSTGFALISGDTFEEKMDRMDGIFQAHHDVRGTQKGSLSLMEEKVKESHREDFEAEAENQHQNDLVKQYQKRMIMERLQREIDRAKEDLMKMLDQPVANSMPESPEKERAEESMSKLYSRDNSSPSSVRVSASIWSKNIKPVTNTAISTFESNQEQHSRTADAPREHNYSEAIAATLQALDQKDASNLQIIQELEGCKHDLTLASQNPPVVADLTDDVNPGRIDDNLEVASELFDILIRLTREKQEFVEENASEAGTETQQKRDLMKEYQKRMIMERLQREIDRAKEDLVKILDQPGAKKILSEGAYRKKNRKEKYNSPSRRTIARSEFVVMDLPDDFYDDEEDDDIKLEQHAYRCSSLGLNPEVVFHEGPGLSRSNSLHRFDPPIEIIDEDSDSSISSLEVNEDSEESSDEVDFSDYYDDNVRGPDDNYIPRPGVQRELSSNDMSELVDYLQSGGKDSVPKIGVENENSSPRPRHRVSALRPGMTRGMSNDNLGDATETNVVDIRSTVDMESPEKRCPRRVSALRPDITRGLSNENLTVEDNFSTQNEPNPDAPAHMTGTLTRTTSQHDAMSTDNAILPDSTVADKPVHKTIQSRIPKPKATDDTDSSSDEDAGPRKNKKKLKGMARINDLLKRSQDYLVKARTVKKEGKRPVKFDDEARQTENERLEIEAKWREQERLANEAILKAKEKFEEQKLKRMKAREQKQLEKEKRALEKEQQKLEKKQQRALEKARAKEVPIPRKENNNVLAQLKRKKKAYEEQKAQKKSSRKPTSSDGRTAFDDHDHAKEAQYQALLAMAMGKSAHPSIRNKKEFAHNKGKKANGTKKKPKKERKKKGPSSNSQKFDRKRDTKKYEDIFTRDEGSPKKSFNSAAGQDVSARAETQEPSESSEWYNYEMDELLEKLQHAQKEAREIINAPLLGTPKTKKKHKRRASITSSFHVGMEFKPTPSGYMY